MSLIDSIMNDDAAFGRWFRSTKVGERLVAEEQKRRYDDRARDVVKRKSVWKRLGDLRANAPRTLEPLQAAVEEARKAYESAQSEFTRARRDTLGDIAAVQREADAIDNHLRATADPRIRDARRHLQARYDSGRHTFRRYDDAFVFDASRSSGKKRMVATNEAACTRVMLAFRAALRSLDELLLENPVDVDAAIAQAIAPYEEALARIGELDPSVEVA